MSDPSKWKRKIDALIRLAEDQRGKPEGDLAREKLAEILRKHPEAVRYEPLQGLARRDISMKDVAWMHRHEVSTDGSWTAATLQEALAKMVDDYYWRMVRRWSTARPTLPEEAEGPE